MMRRSCSARASSARFRCIGSSSAVSSGDQCISQGACPGLSPGSGARLARLELFRRQLVTAEQLVEVRAVALRQARGLTDVAAGDLQDLRKIAAGKFVARFVERGQAARATA